MFQTKAICKVLTPHAPFPEISPGSTGHPEVNDAFDSETRAPFPVAFVPYTLCQVFTGLNHYKKVFPIL